MCIELRQKANKLDGDLETPVSLFIDKVANRSGLLLESAERDGRRGRYSLVADNFLLVIKSVQGKLDLEFADPIFEPLKQYEGLDFHNGLRQVMANLEINKDPDFETLPTITRGIYGYLSYEVIGIMEPKLNGLLQKHEVESVFVLPGSVFLFDHSYNRLTHLSLLNAEAQKLKVIEDTEFQDITTPPKIGAISSADTKEEFIDKVEQIQDLIQQGVVTQLVLSLNFSASFEGDLFSVYRQLRIINPSPYMFFMRYAGFSLAVSSPEVMISSTENTLKLCPIAGTRPRGLSLDQDNIFEADLSADPKEQAEHVMLVDLGRNDLGQVAKTGSVQVDRFMEVERFSHVMHLTSFLSATLDEGYDAIDVIKATLPAGTLSGAPKLKSLELISKFEGRGRGPYGGGMGWLGLDKDSVNLDLGITIRSLWSHNNKIEWQAGAGVVADSEPESEWNECFHKSRAMRTVIERLTDKHTLTTLKN